MSINSRILIPLALALLVTTAKAEEYRLNKGIFYLDENISDKYALEKCRLDFYYPTDKQDFPTVVWFHAGGLRGGERYIPQQFKDKGIAVVAAGYRLHPKAKSPIYLEDASAAVAWTFNHIKDYGGSEKKIFVAGHSAGGYLANMIGLDKSYLGHHGIDANKLAGIISYSGHAITHFTVREERGIPGHQAIIDEMAPLYHVRNDVSPILILTGDRELELLGRYEESAYFWRMLKVAGHKNATLHELKNFDHGKMVGAGHPLLLEFIAQNTPN